jgi:hypothetical protein
LPTAAFLTTFFLGAVFFPALADDFTAFFFAAM